MLSEVFEIFSGRVGIISVVLSLFRGFERFLGVGIGVLRGAKGALPPPPLKLVKV